MGAVSTSATMISTGTLYCGRGYRDQCGACQSLDEDKGEVWHDDKVRCPKCRHLMGVHGSELYDLYEEGTHDTSCQSCGHDFEVTTRVSHSFMSPELIEEPEESTESEPHENT